MAESINIEDIKKDFERQISEIKKELKVLSKSAKDSGEDIYEGAYEGAVGHARNAVRQIRERAQVATEAIRENPATATTILSSTGILGFLVGFVVGQALNGSRR